MKAVSLTQFLRAHRMELTGLVLSLLVCDLFLPQVLNFSHRNDAIREVPTLLPLWKTLESLEYRLYEARFTARGSVKPASRDKIAIIGVDQMTLNVLGDWPYPREWHAQVIQRLKKAGAKVIFLDIDFSGRQNITTDAALACVACRTEQRAFAFLFSARNENSGHAEKNGESNDSSVGSERL